MRTPFQIVRLILPLASAGLVFAHEQDVLDHLRAYFEAGTSDRKQELVSRIESDPVYDRAKVGKWLHQAGLFEALQKGPGALLHEAVTLSGDRTRGVVVRLPQAYDPSQAWPMIYALHGTGGTALEMIEYVDSLLGPRSAAYIVAAPQDYEQYVVHDPGPDDEHLRVLAYLHRRFHLDSDRVYLTGYSRGGHATWTLAILHADQFAGGMALAGTFAPTGVEALWDSFLPNVRHLRMWTVWGASDTRADGGADSPQGGIAGINRKLEQAAERLKLPARFLELADRGHAGVRPSTEVVDEWLAARRVTAPLLFEHSFRWPYQAGAYWLEAAEWKGAAWDNSTTVSVSPRKGESPQDAYHRELRARLGRITGHIDGQTIDVRRDQVQQVTIWITDGMIDWARPVVIKVSGRVIYEGQLQPNLRVCLAQVEQTYDLDRLRWAGVRFRAGRKAEVVQP